MITFLIASVSPSNVSVNQSTNESTASATRGPASFSGNSAAHG